MERRVALQNISLRYGRFSPIPETPSETDNNDDVYATGNPGGPISLRLPTDETDTESDAGSNSDESASDDGEEFLTNPQVRAQRQAEARYRLNNSKEYLRSSYNEATVQAEVPMVLAARLCYQFFQYIANLVLIVLDPIYRFLQHIFARAQQLFGAIDRIPQYIIDLAPRLLSSMLDILSRVFFFTLDILNRLLFFALDLINRLLRGLLNIFRFTIWVFADLVLHLGRWIVYTAQLALQSAENLLRLTISLLSTLLQLVYDHGELALTVIVYLIVWSLFLSPFVVVGFGLMRGYKGTVNYVCNDTALRHTFTDLTGACNHPKLNATLTMESQQLQELLETSRTIIDENRLVHYGTKLDATAYNELLDGVTGLEWFVKEQRDSLSDPEAMDEIVEWMKSNITFIGTTAFHFFGDYQLREIEMMRYLESVLDGTKGTMPDTARARFFSETLYALLPSAFAQTHTARQVQNYIRVAKKFQDDTERLVQFDDPGSFSEAIRAIERGYDLVHDELAGSHEYYELPCDERVPWDKYKCKQTAQWVVARFSDIPEAREWAVAWETAGKHHLGILRAGARLHVHLSGLLGDAVSRGQKVDAMSARAILRKFIVETGEVATKLGY